MMEAYVLVKTAGGKAKEVLKEVKDLEGVKEANGVYGSVDIIVKAEAEDVADLVVDGIRKLSGVSDTNTLIIAL